METSISLIHPSRQRAFKAFKTYEEWITKCSGKHSIEYILSVDNDDPELPQYCEYFKTEDNSIKILMNDNRSCVDAINNGAEQSTGNILIVVSDDMFPSDNWDQQIIEATTGQEDWLLKVHDGTEGWLVTLSIMDRKYYNRFGYIYNPEFAHLWVDTEQTTVAIYLGRLIEANHILFEHRHWTKESYKPTDASYQRSNSTWTQGEKTYIRRFNENFGLKPEEIVGRITDEATIKFIRQRGARI